MPLADYLAGLAFFGGTFGAVACASALLVRRRLPALRGAVRAVAAGVVFTSLILAVHAVPGLVGVLSRWSALAAALGLLFLVALRVRPAGEQARAPDDRDPAPSGATSWVLAGSAVTIVAIPALARAWRALAEPATSVDTLTYHLPIVAAWMQGGSLWQVDQFVPIWAMGNYPHNGDLLSLAVLQPWQSDAFVRLSEVPFVGLAGVAIYALALELRARRATAVLCAAVFCSLPSLLNTAYAGALTDTFMTATFASGAVFLVRSWRTRAPSDLLIAGLGLGLCLGAKWNGFAFAVATLVLWAAIAFAARRSPRAVGSEAGILVGAVALAGGFWLLRNLVLAGNPVIPLRLDLLGVTVFDAPPDEIRDCVGFRVVDYLGSPDVLREYFWPGYRMTLGLPGAALAAGLGGGALVAARRAVRRGGGSAVPLAVAAGGLMLLAVYAITPFSALGLEGAPLLVGPQARFALPALAIAAAVCAWAIARLGRSRLIAEAGLLLVTADGVRRSFDVPLRTLAVAAVVLGVGAALLYVLRRADSRVRLAVALAALAVLAAAGHERQRDFHDGRYAGREPAIDWIQRNAPEDMRIALAGVWDPHGLIPTLPAFGPRLENEVEYVARSDQSVLREYETRAEWARAVRAGGFDLLVVGRGGGDPQCPVPGAETDEAAFARAEGFPVLAASDRLILYRVSR